MSIVKMDEETFIRFCDTVCLEDIQCDDSENRYR